LINSANSLSIKATRTSQNIENLGETLHAVLLHPGHYQEAKKTTLIHKKWCIVVMMATLPANLETWGKILVVIGEKCSIRNGHKT
jgi:hypothetical protein